MQFKFGSKLILIYLISLCLALAAVLISAQSIISQQIQRRYQKKLDTLAQNVMFQLDKKKDEVRLMARATASLGQMGRLVAQNDFKAIRRLVEPVFRESGLDILFVVSPEYGLLQLQTDRLSAVGRSEIPLIRQAILGDYRLRLSRWKHGLFITGSQPILQDEQLVGRVYAGVLIGNYFVRELAKDTDAFMAIVKEGTVLASTLSKKEGEPEELEFSDDLLQDIKGFKGQALPVYVEETLYTMKSQPLRDEGGHLLGFLVIGLSRSEVTQTADALQRNIVAVGLAAAALGVLLTILLTHRMRKQIQHLSAGTEQISRGRLSKKIPVISGDELGALARSFNQMSGTLEERNQILEEEKEKILANVDFLSMMVHDVKAPISGVRLMVEVLLEEDPPEESARRLRGMRESIEELLAHLQNVLAITQIEKGPFVIHKEPLQINNLIPLVRSQCQILAESKQIHFREEADPAVPMVEGDEFYLERLLYNILINALHWAPRGGWVKMRTGSRLRDNTTWAILEVIDNGPGIAREQKPQLFQKFSAGRERGNGGSVHTGLGLYIARIIARAHGGFIEEEGPEGGGAHFVLYLPATAVHREDHGADSRSG